jgi:hypothetical protein
MFGATRFYDFPVGLAWFALISFCLFFLALLVRKIKAYEVIS